MSDDTFVLAMIGLMAAGMASGFFLSRWIRMREERRLRAELETKLAEQRDALAGKRG